MTTEITPEMLAQLSAGLAKLQNTNAAEDLGSMGDDDLAVTALRNYFGGSLSYSLSLGWRYFPEDAHTWETDRRGEDVTRTVQSMLRELRRGERDGKVSQSLGSRVRRDNVVAMLRGLPEVAYGGDWDADAHLIAAPNGVIDLRDGSLRRGEPGDRITKSVSVEYDPAAECPRWLRFLDEVFAHDPELPAYVQRLIGYGATGSNAEQCFAVLWGGGSNGKSVFLTALRRIMGDHAATVPFDMFTVSGKARGGPDTEMLVGARLALASETNRSAVLDAAAIKNATGGEEITVNPKYRDPYTFTPEALILLASNYKPIVKEQDSGTWRRIKLIPFQQKFEGDAKDIHLGETLRAEYPGILRWIVDGARDWYEHGLSDPASVREAISAYQEESDSLAGFMPGVLTLVPGRWTANADIWQAYTQWAADNGEESFGRSSTLNKALIERSKGRVEADKKNGKRVLRGVALTADITAEEARAADPGIFGAD